MIHADLHLDNILSFDDSLTVIDFDDSGFGWHACDLAHALWDPELLSSPAIQDCLRVNCGWLHRDERRFRFWI